MAMTMTMTLRDGPDDDNDDDDHKFIPDICNFSPQANLFCEFSSTQKASKQDCTITLWSYHRANSTAIHTLKGYTLILHHQRNLVINTSLNSI